MTLEGPPQGVKKGSLYGGTRIGVYSGQYYDGETGLHYNYWRYYDPKIGRYLRADPIGLDGGINPYTYALNGPVNWTDPEGLHKGDKWYGYDDKDFQKWFHRCWKDPGAPNAEKEEIGEAYEEWLRNGSPKGGKCGGPGDPPPAPACGDDCKEVAKAAALLGVGYGVYKVGKICILTFFGGPVGFGVGVVTP